MINKAKETLLNSKLRNILSKFTENRNKIMINKAKETEQRKTKMFRNNEFAKLNNHKI